jgi:hypothetical protein
MHCVQVFAEHEDNIEAIKSAMEVLATGNGGMYARTLNQFKHTWVAGQMIDKRIEVLKDMVPHAAARNALAAPSPCRPPILPPSLPPSLSPHRLPTPYLHLQ